MNFVIQELKKINEYTEAPGCCNKCRFFSVDNSTDNFGPGDCCVRNPEFIFQVKSTATCNKYTELTINK